MFKTKNFTCVLLVTGLISTLLLGCGADSEVRSKHALKDESLSSVAKIPVMAITSTGRNLIAVGASGEILTKDLVGNWTGNQSPSTALLTGLAFSDEMNGWAVGHDATILHSANGGKNWRIQRQQPELDRPYLDITFTDAKHGFAVGAYGMFAKTSDGGATWNNVFLDSLLPADDVEYLQDVRAESEADYQFEISSILPHFNKIIVLNDQRLLLVGELGLIALSADNGESWTRQSNIYHGSFFTAMQTHNHTMLVGGLRGHVFRSADNGLTWQQIDLNNNHSINDISQLSNGHVYISQNNGVILKSIDDGQSFTAISLQKGQDLMGVREFNQQIWVAGSKGLNRLQQVK